MLGADNERSYITSSRVIDREDPDTHPELNPRQIDFLMDRLERILTSHRFYVRCGHVRISEDRMIVIGIAREVVGLTNSPRNLVYMKEELDTYFNYSVLSIDPSPADPASEGEFQIHFDINPHPRDTIMS